MSAVLPCERPGESFSDKDLLRSGRELIRTEAAIYQGLTSSKVIEKYRSDLARALLLDAGVPSVKG